MSGDNGVGYLMCNINSYQKPRGDQRETAAVRNVFRRASSLGVAIALVVLATVALGCSNSTDPNGQNGAGSVAKVAMNLTSGIWRWAVWTQVRSPETQSNGSVSLSDERDDAQIVGSNYPEGGPVANLFSRLEIPAPETAAIHFHWYYLTYDTGGPSYDIAYYYLGNAVTCANNSGCASPQVCVGSRCVYQLSDNVGSTTQSGTVTLPGVAAGTTVGFGVTATDNIRGAASLTISFLEISGAADGTACTQNAECLHTSCVDGVCCATACGGGVTTDCQACSIAAGGSADGTCTTLPDTYLCRQATDVCDVADYCSGVTGEVTCTTDVKAASTTSCDDLNACTLTDHCDGAGVCTHDSTVDCSPASDQCHVVGTCNPADGSCSDPAAEDGVTCNDSNACTQTDTCQAGVCTGASPVICTASDQCHVAGECNPADGSCTNPNVSDNTGCNDGNACTLGDVCTSGTCAGTQNPCVALDACHLDGTCSNTETGACEYPNASASTDCNDGNGCTTSDKCNGSGVCVGGTRKVCNPDECHNAGECVDSLGLCEYPSKADGTACSIGTCQSGVCRRPLGSSCTTGGDCLTGYCVDGYCCNTSCTGQCQACDLADLHGTCSPVTGAPHGTRSACIDGGLGCGGSCNGTVVDNCTYPTTSCRAAACTDGEATLAANCDGAGNCPDIPYLCAPYACKNTEICDGTCTAEDTSNCTVDQYCPAGKCEAKKIAGDVCGADTQCASGHCVDGVCCDTACAGKCEACDVETFVGTCSPVIGPPHSARGACASDQSVCGGLCDGSQSRTACTYPGAATSCRTASCSGEGEAAHAVAAAVCDGAGACPLEQITQCTPYQCSGSVCAGCTTDDTCGSSSYCTAGTCVAKRANGATCTSGASNQCASGICADGVCCNAACTGQCQACDNAGSVGTCSPVTGNPHGSRTACEGSAPCVGQCNGLKTDGCVIPCTTCPTCAHGDCEHDNQGNSLCTCSSGWTGTLCDRCATGYYGAACAACPTCAHGSCGESLAGDGKCTCVTGWSGALCDECASGYYGETCKACPACAHGICNGGLTGNGACSCATGWTGTSCDQCAAGYYGSNCTKCPSCAHGTCNEGLKGTGLCACEDNWTGTLCNTASDGTTADGGKADAGKADAGKVDAGKTGGDKTDGGGALVEDGGESDGGDGSAELGGGGGSSGCGCRVNGSDRNDKVPLVLTFGLLALGLVRVSRRRRP